MITGAVDHYVARPLLLKLESATPEATSHAAQLYVAARTQFSMLTRRDRQVRHTSG
jgi:hypothetical protein